MSKRLFGHAETARLKASPFFAFIDSLLLTEDEVDGHDALGLLKGIRSVAVDVHRQLVVVLIAHDDGLNNRFTYGVDRQRDISPISGSSLSAVA